MAELIYLASALVTTVVLAAVVVAAVRFGNWQSYVVGRGGTAVDRLGGLADSPAAWMATFVALVLGFGGATVLFVSGTVDAATIGIALVVGTVVVLGGYVFVGFYTAARSRGRPAAQGVAEAVVMLGVIVVFAIAAKLVAG